MKMYPRFSETFILNEVLELERQGMEVRIFSLKKADDGRFHADISRVRAKVSYLPEHPLLAAREYYAAHRQLFKSSPGRYARALLRVLARRSSGSVKRFLQAGHLAVQLRQENIEHIHAHFASSAAAVAYYAHELAGISYSFTAHAKDIYRDGIDTDHLRTKLREARFVVTVSDYNRKYLQDLCTDARIERVYYGLDLGHFVPNGAAPADPPIVLAVGRLVEKKGFLGLVRTCHLLREEGVSFRCRIVGKGPDELAIRRLVRSLGLQGVVELPGTLPREEVVQEYSRARVVVAPCVVGSDGNRDGLPTVLIEAMALGVPVISTDVTGIPELVEDGRTGLIVPQHDPTALANAIHRVLNNPATAATLGEAGRRRVEAQFHLRENVAHLRDLFEEVVV